MAVKRVPHEAALNMLEVQYADFLREGVIDVAEEWEKFCGACHRLVTIRGEVFLDVDDDCSFGLEEYPDAPGEGDAELS